MRLSQCHIRAVLVLAVSWIACGEATAQPPAPAHVTLTASDGAKLKATYYAAGKPGPGIVLLHQCNRDRQSWTAFASRAAERSYHVIAMDYRGFGESDGERFTTFQERQPVIDQKWPGDVDAAFAWLTAQPGVDRERIGAAGASCGVNQAVLLSRRHPEVRTIVLLSGGVTPPAREHLRKSAGMPILASASQGDGDAVNTMRWILGWSSNPANKFIEYNAAGHGTEMFAAEKGLEPAMLDWFDAHLRSASLRPVTTSAAAPSPLEEFWNVLAKPDGRERALKLLEETKRRDPKLVLFPEGELNAYGYQVLQAGAAQHAVWLFQLNVDTYPNSANTYDSLSDALLAAGNRKEALYNAEKALEVLGRDKSAPDEFRAAIKESAEKKIRELKKES